MRPKHKNERKSGTLARLRSFWKDGCPVSEFKRKVDEFIILLCFITICILMFCLGKDRMDSSYCKQKCKPFIARSGGIGGQCICDLTLEVK